MTQFALAADRPRSAMGPSPRGHNMLHAARAATLAIALSLPLAGCSSQQERDAVLAQEQRAETLIERLEAIPDRTPELDAILEQARRDEAKLQATREALEATSKESLIGTGVDVGTDVASGDWLGALGTLLGTAGAGLTLLLRKKLRVDVGALEQRAERAEAEAAALKSTLELQGIAASGRSAQASQSAAALAAKRAREAEAEEALQRALAKHSAPAPITPPAPPLTAPAPGERSATDELIAQLSAALNTPSSN